jgi:hypothetical protein
MSSLRSSDSRIRRCNSSGTEPINIPDPNTLPGLIPDLLLCISDYLYSADLICLSLCNRRFFAVFYKEEKHPPETSLSGKLCILNRLARDLPSYFVCEVCVQLHRYDGSKCLGISVEQWEKACGITCWVPDLWETCRLHRTIKRLLEPTSYEQLLSRFTELIVRVYHEGPAPNDINDSLYFVQFKHHYCPQSFIPSMISLCTIEARVCPSPTSLCLRSQDMLLVQTSQMYRLHSAPFMLPICEHVPRLMLHDFLVPSILWSFSNGDWSSFTYTCDECNIDCQVELRVLGAVTVLVMTRWMIHGPGLAPYTSGWTIHCEKGSYVRRLPDPFVNIVSPRRYFESASPRSLELLRSYNLSYLIYLWYDDFMWQAVNTCSRLVLNSYELNAN